MNNPINIQFLSGIHNGGRPTTPGSKTATARSTATPSRSFYLDVGTTLTLVGLTCEEWSGTAWVAIATGEDLTYSKVRVTATSSADWDTLLSPTINTLVYSLRTPVDPATVGIAARYTNTEHYTGTENYL